MSKGIEQKKAKGGAIAPLKSKEINIRVSSGETEREPRRGKPLPAIPVNKPKRRRLPTIARLESYRQGRASKGTRKILNSNISTAEKIEKLKKMAAGYSKRYGVKDTTPEIKRGDKRELLKVAEEYEKMKTARWARKVRETYEKKEEERKAKLPEREKERKEPEKIPEKLPEEKPEEREEEQKEPEKPEPEIGPDTSTAERVRDYAKEIYDMLVGYYGDKATEWPIEKALDLLINEIDNIIGNGIDEALDNIENNADTIYHLIEQGTAYEKSEKRGASYYTAFINQIEMILHGTSFFEIDSGGWY